MGFGVADTAKYGPTERRMCDDIFVILNTIHLVTDPLNDD